MHVAIKKEGAPAVRGPRDGFGADRLPAVGRRNACRSPARARNGSTSAIPFAPCSTMNASGVVPENGAVRFRRSSHAGVSPIAKSSAPRTFARADLARFDGRERTVGDVLRPMRCSGGCGGRVGAAWLEAGPILNTRDRPRGVALLGPEARE